MLKMLLYDTLTGDKRPFAPLSPYRVGLYLCGPTVYGDAHLGHGRGAVVFDVLRRFMEGQGHAVALVRNYTDIDDKILARANVQGVGFEAVASRCIARYEADMERLHVRPPDHSPRATQYIRPMQEMIGRMLQKGNAYRIRKRVYFRVGSFPDYGRLSRRNAEAMTARSRIDANPEKADPRDFLLWKPSRPEEPGWDSPWGRGRPGWHIECSAMSRALLGDQFDIHGGGVDLLFPHHENEIAQSQATTGAVPARFWVHHGMIEMDGRKMSKSTGRIVTLRELFEVYPPEAVRLFLLSKHYRRPLEYRPERMAAAAAGVARICRALDRAHKVMGPSDPAVHPLEDYWSGYSAAMADDLNVPAAISVLFLSVRHLNQALNSARKGAPSTEDIHRLAGLRAVVLKLSREILGITLTGHRSCISPYR